MTPSILFVIPLYNHGTTLRGVVENTLAQCTPEADAVLVVDDGSTDNGVDSLQGLPVTVVRHSQNQGKGRAIITAAREAAARGYTHILTLDADGQHDPMDIPVLLEKHREHPAAIIVGARRFNGPYIPTASRFGRTFSSFWMRLQTGLYISDMQSGFRLYPVESLLTLSNTEPRFAFEVEVLVRAVWAGFTVLETPVHVYYPPADKRISHFDKFKDNLRISLLNTRLTIRALLPVPFRQHTNRAEPISIAHPLESLHLLLADNATPSWLGRSAAIGFIISALPLPGLQCLLLLYCIGQWKLNRLCALAVMPLTWPPFVPGLAILLGYRLRQGVWLTEFSIQTLGHEIGQRVVDWGVGSLVLAPAAGVVLGGMVWLLAWMISRKALKRKIAI